MERVLGGDSAHFDLRFLSAEQIRTGSLSGFDVLVQGGGNSLIQSKELKEDGREAIRKFVRAGGGYVGICGGAHFTVPGDELKLGILNARVVDNAHWARGRGDVILDFTPDGQKELGEPSAKTKVMYHQGPLLAPGDRSDLPPYTLLASYETEVAKNGAPHGVMQGTAAIVSASYGQGRVFVFGPHPEQTQGQEGLVRAALLWAAGRTQQPIAPVSAPAPAQQAVAPPPSSAATSPVAVHPPVDTGCCGPVTAAGVQLQHYLDSLNVDHLWEQHTFVDWRTGEPVPSKGRREPPTHCSAFAAGAADRLGIYLLHPPDHSQEQLAAAQERWMGSDAGRAQGWFPVSSALQAQMLANLGNLVVLVYGREHGSGHIAIVRPAVKSRKQLDEDGPETTQAGGHNFSDGTAKYSFVFHPGAWPNQVKIFAHATKFSEGASGAMQP